MGEHEGCVEPGRPLPNGLLPGAGLVMQALDTGRWLKAEERTAELIACIQPNQLSEERRNAVADYVQRLIMKCIPCQVCTFGSVPLKTYLPDGDIDLTAFTHSANLKDTCANQVRDMLENEERNENAEFHVKEVQYIQAEVKIIKCLVENIVVDISFNQVGGLCTLCFLDEVDNLINQNHLFKRSIILIKAWCYYESRILGAHHGLISTYALETLVLYIFHVFNNSFHGPLEVLYRFLEFFSNFDWNNFCVSLWGPVPISSLPDVTAQPPRKDSGELLLSKLFLDSCSSVYAVLPGGQENNGQSFVSKHFNVIDPLRVNNNLGRSVSKGNFFRIRSAFAFGAKRLARLLDCPRENLVFEVNQFFLNTWERHGSGHRPDVREIDIWRSRLSPPDSSHESENSKDNISWKKVNENASVHGMEGGGIHAHGVSSQHSKHSHVTVPRTNELTSASRMHTLKSQFNLNSLRDTNRIGREHASNQVVSNDKIQTDKKADHLGNDIRRRSHFARTSSSPELTDAFGDMSSQEKYNRQMDISHSNANSANKRNNFRFENPASHNGKSSVEDTSSIRHAPLHQTLDAADDSHSSFNSCQRDLGLYSLSEELSSTSGAQEMNQEEQDIINMMASTSLQGRNEQAHFPFNLTSAHLPFQIPPSFLASMGYSQRNLPGYLPSSIPLIDQSLSNVPFPHGFVSPQLTHYFPGVGLSSLTEDVDAINDNFGSPEELNPVEVDNDFWQEQDVNSSGDHPENGNFELFHSVDKSPVTMPGLKYVPPFRASASGSATKVQHKHAREKGGSVQENSDNFPIKNSDFYAEERSASSRFSSATQSNSLRSRTSSESSWDGSSVKTSKSAKEKRGKKIFSVDVITGQGKGKHSECVAYQAEDDEQEWGSSSQAETEMAESDLGPEPLASQLPRHHVPGFEIAQTSGSDSMIPIAPVLLGPGSRHGMNDNSGMVAFYPTGPPIPFLTMLRVYDVPPETGTSEASNGHFGVDETLDISQFGQKFSSEGFGSSEELNSSSSLRGIPTNETFEEHKSDILNSDFASHWQNLQFGRFCENARYHGPLAYSSPVMVPPGYLQGRFPDDNTNRPLVANTNLVSQLVANYGHCLVPVTPLPSVSSVPPNMYQRYMDDMPRHRSGTGTYLPNPKVSTRERQFSGTRRGNYNHDRNDNYSDREGNWNAYSKSRATATAARNHNRSQIDRSNLRSDRLNTSESQTDRSWNSYRHDSIPFYQFQNGPFRSNPSQNSSQNVAYSMYPFAAAHPNGVSNGPSVPPVMMLYPFDHNMTYGSHGEQLEYGTLGPAGFPGINEQSQLNESIPARGFEDHRIHGGSEHRSSPDEPSSPHYQR